MSLSDKIAHGNFTNVQNFIRVKDVKEFIKKLRKELLEVVDDVQSDWSYITEEYNKKIDELAGDELVEEGVE